jgi:glycine cleavage system H protein
MKEIDELKFSDNLHYTGDHEWVKVEGDTAKIGISDYAQDQLGDIVFVELPNVGDSFQKGDEFGTVESVKAVSELYIPISGEVTAINNALEDSPELVNTQPYDDGWMIAVKIADPSELDALMSKDDYYKMIKEME